MKDIKEALTISKQFVLNMEEIDYDKLIEFLQDMKEKNEKFLKIQINRGSSKGEWLAYSTDKNGEHLYNKTNLN